MMVSWSKRRPPTALTIAGSDSGGGAGIQADLKTFLVHGVYGMSAITSVTAQNTKEVRAISDIPPDVVASQIEAVSEDIGVDAAKTGMLSSKEIILAVSKTLKKYEYPLVVDPVMVSKSGAKLLKDDAIDALKKEILPRAYIVTPNRMEAEVLSDIRILNEDDAIFAAKKISVEYGTEAILIKGGHFADKSSATDILYYNGTIKFYRGERIEDGCTHGTGCSFSAAIAANLAWGVDLLDAIKNAKEFITHSIKTGIKYGEGHCPVNPSSWLFIPAEKYNILENLKSAVALLVENGSKLVDYYPEVGINLVMSLPFWYARDENDVAGIPGRIIRVGNKLEAPHEPRFGASKHMAKAVLTMMKFDPRKRAAMNIAYDRFFLKNAERNGLVVSGFDRRYEPESIKAIEGGTTPWGIEYAVSKAKGVPDVIYDLGEHGKEPLIFVFGETAVDVVKKVLLVIKEETEYPT